MTPDWRMKSKEDYGVDGLNMRLSKHRSLSEVPLSRYYRASLLHTINSLDPGMFW
jgi:hypothetical protein